MRRAAQQREDLHPATQISARQLPNDEGVAEHLAILEQLGESTVGRAEVVHPYRCVDEDHRDRRGRRRGIARTPRSVPPKAANRRALSRATNASSPARTTAVFSRRPLSAVARSSKASSILRVVRICISMPVRCISFKALPVPHRVPSRFGGPSDTSGANRSSGTR